MQTGPQDTIRLKAWKILDVAPEEEGTPGLWELHVQRTPAPENLGG